MSHLCREHSREILNQDTVEEAKQRQKITRMCLASPVPSLSGAGHLNSMSAPNVSCQRQCEYDYTLISRSHTQNGEA